MLSCSHTLLPKADTLKYKDFRHLCDLEWPLKITTQARAAVRTLQPVGSAAWNNKRKLGPSVWVHLHSNNHSWPVWQSFRWHVHMHGLIYDTLSSLLLSFIYFSLPFLCRRHSSTHSSTTALMDTLWFALHRPCEDFRLSPPARCHLLSHTCVDHVSVLSRRPALTPGPQLQKLVYVGVFFPSVANL